MNRQALLLGVLHADGFEAAQEAAAAEVVAAGADAADHASAFAQADLAELDAGVQRVGEVAGEVTQVDALVVGVEDIDPAAIVGVVERDELDFDPLATGEHDGATEAFAGQAGLFGVVGAILLRGDTEGAAAVLHGDKSALRVALCLRSEDSALVFDDEQFAGANRQVARLHRRAVVGAWHPYVDDVCEAPLAGEGSAQRLVEFRE